MDPIKFDEHLKGKLENRRVKPSTESWSKLSSRLEAKEAKPNAGRSWLFMAASIIAVLLVATQFFNNNTETIKVLPSIEPTKAVIVEQANEEVKTLNKDVNDVEVDQLVKDTPVIEQGIDEVNTIVALEDKIVAKEEQKIEAVSKVAVVENLTFEAQKIQDLVVQIHTMKNENKEVSDDEIEALLQQAEKEIKLKRLQDKSFQKVDAIALLEDVEAELDQSFRTKVFEAIKASYNSVKTAVAQRNN
ncbi:hypothetical protein [Snuella sedimenti]|uniref:Uncharacterized protein n=1 Tax=Snuella sedimenti TaxID=2798802 RepID=A0A8J7ILH1_9FLAO|nr:hypothetical protein [Snuella sedimenti]MBJ6366567.1 hypothetical protein [Snuella sedimenti]